MHDTPLASTPARDVCGVPPSVAATSIGATRLSFRAVTQFVQEVATQAVQAAMLGEV